MNRGKLGAIPSAAADLGASVEEQAASEAKSFGKSSRVPKGAEEAETHLKTSSTISMTSSQEVEEVRAGEEGSRLKPKKAKT